MVENVDEAFYVALVLANSLIPERKNVKGHGQSPRGRDSPPKSIERLVAFVAPRRQILLDEFVPTCFDAAQRLLPCQTTQLTLTGDIAFPDSRPAIVGCADRMARSISRPLKLPCSSSAIATASTQRHRIAIRSSTSGRSRAPRPAAPARRPG